MPLSTQVYKWALANYMYMLGKPCDRLASHPGGAEIILSVSCNGKPEISTGWLATRLKHRPYYLLPIQWIWLAMVRTDWNPMFQSVINKWLIKQGNHMPSVKEGHHLTWFSILFYVLISQLIWTISVAVLFFSPYSCNVMMFFSCQSLSWSVFFRIWVKKPKRKPQLR